MFTPSRIWLIGALCLSLARCAARPSSTDVAPDSSDVPLGLQMLRTEAQLKNYPFFTLISFERDSDPVFARVEGAAPSIDSARAHTGRQSLRIPPGSRNLAIKLSSLHSGRDWPGNWALIGAYFYTQQPQRLTASYEINGSPLASYTVELPGGQWTPVLLDIAAVLDAKPAQPIGTLRFHFGSGPRGPIWCDDVIEMDNTNVRAEAPGGWTVTERGFLFIAARPGFFRAALKTPEASEQGWKLVEANEIRAIFTSTGRQKQMILYSDGRQFVDGKFAPLARPQDVFNQQHATPPRITVTPETGRLERNSPGDENNDGYVETTGLFPITATGPRLQLRIEPETPAVLNPVLDIAGLPEGKVLANMEGKVVEKIVRLDSGHVLIELTGALSRPTTVNVKVVK